MLVPSEGVAPDQQVVEVMVAWQRLVDGGQVDRGCRVEVERQQHWFVLSGWVDSFQAKCRLMALVPEHEGARWIVDRIRVGRPEAAEADATSDPVRTPMGEPQTPPAP